MTGVVDWTIGWYIGGMRNMRGPSPRHLQRVFEGRDSLYQLMFGTATEDRTITIANLLTYRALCCVSVAQIQFCSGRHWTQVRAPGKMPPRKRPAGSHIPWLDPNPTSSMRVSAPLYSTAAAGGASTPEFPSSCFRP